MFLTTLIPIFRDSLSRFPARPQETRGEKHFRPLRKAPWASSTQNPTRAKGAFSARFRDGAHGSAAKTTAGTWLGRERGWGWNVAGVGTWLGRGRGWGGDVAGTCGRGRRPRRPAPGAGRPAAPRRGRRGYGRDKRGPPAWHRAISLRNARVPAPRHEAPQDEISPRNNLESRRAARRVRHVRPSPGLSRRPGRGEKRTRSRFLPIACLS